MIRKYKIKPQVIEAVQWRGNNLEEVLKLLNNNKHCTHHVVDDNLVFKSNAGLFNISLNQYVIKDELCRL